MNPEVVSDRCETSEFPAKECGQHQGGRRERDKGMGNAANERVSDVRFDEMPRNQVAFDPDDCSHQQLQPSGSV